MLRIVLFLILVALIAAGFAWLADRPGDIVLVWQGTRIETSLLVGLIALIALVVAAILLWSILRALMRTPENVSLFFRHRRAMKSYQAITRGLIAIGAGDLKLARHAADDAARLSPGEPLALLLEAQASQMSADRIGAERAFRAMTRRDETKLLGLRGLYIEAQRANDPVAARKVAEEAAAFAPGVGWAAEAMLEDRCATGDWTGALDALERMRKGLDKADYRRKRAVLLTARAVALADIDRDQSRAAVLEAVKLAPDLVPAAALAGRRLAESDEPRKARRILERAWETNPHPDIADAYAHVRLGDSARERLARVQKLADKTPGQREAALAVARAALEAGAFETARAALSAYLSAPTQRVAALMAEIEDAEHGDTGRVREWMSRAVNAAPDPVWSAEGVVSEHWLPVTPSGKLDGFEWKVPLAELGVTRPVIEIAPAPVTPVGGPTVDTAAPAQLPTAQAAAGATVIEPGMEPDAESVVRAVPSKAVDSIERDAPAVPAAAGSAAAEARAEKTAENGAGKPAEPTPAEKPVEPVIPLLHAPDDPGPDGALESDPDPATVTAAEDKRWNKIKDLFK
jgi:HemY protein